MSGRERIDAAEADLREAIQQRIKIATEGLSADLARLSDASIGLAIDRLVTASVLTAIESQKLRRVAHA